MGLLNKSFFGLLLKLTDRRVYNFIAVVNNVKT